MKNLKKVLALVVVCAMFFTMSSFAFIDVDENASYLEAVTMLSKLGIINGYEDGTFLPDNTITRAEVAKVLVCALDAADQAKGMVNENTFTDVPADHWAAGYINYAANFGIINGRGNGIFDPEAPVTYEEVVKMIVAMLGYTPVANVKGGYPTGYLYVANNMIKITKGATGSTGDPAKRWVVARMLFNSLEAKIMEQSSWSASDPEFTQGDQTLLTDYLEVTKIEGIVTETFYQGFEDKEDKHIEIEVSAIDGYKNEEDNNTTGWSSDYGVDDLDEVSDYQIEANETGAEEYLGYTVVAYVKDFNGGDDELVAIAPKANKNSTLEVAFNEFEETTSKTGVDTSLSKHISFEYYAEPDDTDVTTAKLYKKGVDLATWYVNSDFKGDIDEGSANIGGTTYAGLINFIANLDTEYDAADGFIRFLDNDGDGIYDIAFVENVNKEYVVDEITARTYKITDKINGGSKKFDPTDDEVYVTFYKDGDIVDFDAIAENDVISVVENKNADVVKVYISSDTVEGYVSSVNRTKNQYKIDGAIYSKTKACDTISRGDEGVFYLNYQGRIVYSDSVSSANGNYAFLLSINTEDSFSSGVSYTFRFMNEKGEWVDADLYDKVNFVVCDDKTSDATKIEIDSDDFASEVQSATAGWLRVKNDELILNEPESRVFKYTLNSAGAITEIVIPSVGLGDGYLFAAEPFTDAEYNATKGRFDGISKKADATEDTVIFVVDKDTTIDTVAKKKYVTMGSYTTFKDEQKYTGVAYDWEDDMFKCMVITGSTNAIDEDAHLFVVNTIELTNDGDDDYFVLTGYLDGEKVELESVEVADVTLGASIGTDDDFADLDAGTILELALDGAGKVTDADMLIDVNNVNANFYGESGSGDIDDGVYYAMGLIGTDKVSGTYKYIELVDDYEGNVIAEVPTAGSMMKGTIYAVDLTGRKTVISVDDSISDYLATITDDMDDTDICSAFVKVYDGDVIDIVVYTFEY